MIKGRPIKTIIVDDSEAFLDGLQLMLSKNSLIEVIELCRNGLELVNSQKLSQAGLILTDIHMPEMNGIEAALRVNYDYPAIPIIALTMHREKFFLEDLVSAGFKAFIYKPDVPTKLDEVIGMVLENKYVFPKELKITK